MRAQLLTSAEALIYAGYRLDDLVFWAFPVLAFLICAIHAARRAFRHPTPALEGSECLPAEVTMEARAEGPVQRLILRYTLPQRLFHWANAGACLVLLVSGLAIYSPGLFWGGGSAAGWFAWHRWFALVLMVGLAFHVAYDIYVMDAMGFIWFDREARQTLKQIARSFLGVSSSYPRYAKYNPMQLCAHWLIAGTLSALVVTGMVLWRPLRAVLPLHLLGLGWDVIFFCRILHDLFAAALIALIMGHVYFALVIRKNWVISKAMLTGRIRLDHYLRFHKVTGELVPVAGPMEHEGRGP